MQQRLVIIALAALAIVTGFSSEGRAQATLIPFAPLTFVDANGNPLSGGKLCTYAAGTTTPQPTYSTNVVSVGTQNSNPVIMAANGRPTSGGIFLSPTSYKFVFLSPGTDTTCSTGTILWTLDNIQAVPTTAGNVDVSGTAGETLTAGQVAYISNGSGSLTNGYWYKADSDLAYASGSAALVGVVTADVTSGAQGTFRLLGRVTGLSGLTAGSLYYVSSTAGAITSTAPANARFVGAADSTTSLVLSPAPSTPVLPINHAIDQFRLTLTTGVPVTTSDVTAATTIYLAPYQGNAIALYDSSGVESVYRSAQISIAVPATTSQMYDIFVYANTSGAPALELLAWTNDTTRATAINNTTVSGVYTKTGDATRRYVGSFRTTGVSGQTEDSQAKRYLYNYYNRVPRTLRKTDSTSSWAYTTAAFRQANGSTANQVEIVTGVAETPFDLVAISRVENTNAGVLVRTGIGVGSTTVSHASSIVGSALTQVTNDAFTLPAYLRLVPAVGYQFYAWLEYSTATGTTSWYGATGGNDVAGLFGEVSQ